MASSSILPRLALFEATTHHDPSSLAVVHSHDGRSFNYGGLVRDVACSKNKIAAHFTKIQRRITGERIAFLVENGYDYVVTFLAILANHAVALPLAGSFPPGELRYILEQSKAALFLSSGQMQGKADEILLENLETKPLVGQLDKTEYTNSSGDNSVSLEDVKQEDDRGGLMLYTSGTTSRPKGVLISSANLSAQMYSLNCAWRYNPTDRLLHCLPLHHVHGTMNALLAPLFAGSTIEFLYPFTPDAVWTRLASPFLPEHPRTSSQHHTKPITILTVVPTIYSRLLESHSKLPVDIQAASGTAISPQHLRLNMSGSAALPTPTKSAWTQLSGGNVLLERYGMTEVGMALSCGLSNSDRIDGSVGWPLPLVQARLVDIETGQIIPEGTELDTDGRERSGEIQLRGPTVFEGYFRNPEATVSEFVEPDPADACRARWFKTGDVAVRRSVGGAADKRGEETRADEDWVKGPAYFIQGRKSADIIKTGGEKVSALEVEREMLSLPEVGEVAVVGVSSAKWGQKVAAVVVLAAAGKEGPKEMSPLDLRRKLKERLVAFKCPMEYKFVGSIPRNAMGKVNKKTLVADVFKDRISPPPSQNIANDIPL